MNAHSQPLTAASLTPRQQAIVFMAAFTAKGDLPNLYTALADSLAAG